MLTNNREAIKSMWGCTLSVNKDGITYDSYMLFRSECMVGIGLRSLSGIDFFLRGCQLFPHNGTEFTSSYHRTVSWIGRIMSIFLSSITLTFILILSSCKYLCLIICPFFQKKTNTALKNNVVRTSAYKNPDEFPGSFFWYCKCNAKPGQVNGSLLLLPTRFLVFYS
jgi:hypothetical protein